MHELLENTCHVDTLTPSQWQEVLDITHAAFDEHHQKGLKMTPCTVTLEQHKRFLEGCQIFFIRESNNLIAYKAGKIVSHKSFSYFQVQLTCVHPAFKGKGLGKRVHNALENWAKSMGCQFLLTDTSCKAVSSYSYHKSIGFKDWYYTHFHSKNYNSIVLRKDLNIKFPSYRRYLSLVKSWLTVHLCYKHNGEHTWLYEQYRTKVQHDVRPPKNGERLSLKEVQITAYQLLQAFDSICKKHNLKYFLCYGSLIGAIRHKGFIPWDDDIDVTMPLPDYERLLTIFSQDSPFSDIEILHGMKKNIGIPFAMFVNRKTITFTPGRDKKHSHPIAIDIFPAFALSDIPKDAQQQIDDICGLVSQSRAYYKAPSCRNFRKWLLFHLFGKRKLTRLLKTISEIIHKHPWGSTQHIRIMSLEERDFLAMPSDAFDHFLLCDFEGEQFRIPETYHEHLSELYGDYMQLPPPEARCGVLAEAYKLR